MIASQAAAARQSAPFIVLSDDAFAVLGLLDDWPQGITARGIASALSMDMLRVYAALVQLEGRGLARLADLRQHTRGTSRHHVWVAK